jgi:hypothetical protein
MNLFGLIITTQAEIDKQIEESVSRAKQDLVDYERQIEARRKEYQQYFDASKKDIEEAWKKVEEAEASLILKEIANVMGGRWRG